jgi:glucokinase
VHSDFAPQNEQQIELLRFMRRRYPQVSWELILSGRGFRTLHEFLAPEVKHASFEDPDSDPAPEITSKGLAKSCSVCAETLDLWTSIYGAEAGNLALKFLATGGVFLAGNIAATLVPVLGHRFAQAFLDQGRISSLVQQMPVAIVKSSSIGLTGSARHAAGLT